MCTEKVGLDSEREGCLVFNLERSGGAVPIRKIEVEETQFRQSRIPLERAFFVTNFFSGDAEFLLTVKQVDGRI